MNLQFVNLHTHTNIGSPYDAFGEPKEFVEAAIAGKMNALAITEHGNMNSMAEAYLTELEKKKNGINFKYIKGIEFYYIDSIREWEEVQDKYSKIKNKSRLSEEEFRFMNQKIKQRKHLVVWALNSVGLKNLFKLVSISHQRPFFYKKPRIDFELLSQYSEGLAGSSACVQGVLGELILSKIRAGYLPSEEEYKVLVDEHRKFNELFGQNRWFGELQWHHMPEQNIINRFVVMASKELGIPLITTCDSHYIGKEHGILRNIYVNSRYGQGEGEGAEEQEGGGGTNEEEDSGTENNSNFLDLSLKNGDEVYQLYLECDTNKEFDEYLVVESIKNTQHVADLVEDYELDVSPKMPSFILEKYNIVDENAEKEILYNLCKEELERKNKLTKEYLDRLEQEILLISKKNFVKYFLTMREIVMKAKEHMGVGAARGSAAGSLVAYLLGITMIDPLVFGLSFSRFLTYDSSGYPDIDFDCEAPKELKEMMIKEWGENKLIYVTNWNLLSFKTATKDISKHFGISFSEVNEVTTKALSEYYQATQSEEKKVPEVEEVLEYSETAKKFFAKYPHVGKYISGLKGCVRDLATHAGGVIIGDDLFSSLPVIRVKDKMQTPWPEGQNKRLLEPMGFIKFDILGISTITEVFETLRKILKKRGESTEHKHVMRFYEDKFSPETLNLGLQSVYKNVFGEGNFFGVFQFTSPGAQKFCMKFKPQSILELAIVTSVYRPGPLGANVHEDIVNAKNGLKEINDYDCEEFREVTKDTYGFLIFQEQISDLFCRVTGVSEDEGQKVRKLLTKKKGGDMAKLEPYKNMFFNSLLSRGKKEANVQKLWDIIVLFSGYGFNKSHAVSYAFLSYQCAVLLTYFPEEWISSVLSVEFSGKKFQLLSSLIRMGYKVQVPSLLTSGVEWKVNIDKEKGEKIIYPSLQSIRGITKETAILLESEGKKIKNLFDFYLFCKEYKGIIKKNIIINIVNACLIDHLLRDAEITRDTFLEFIDKYNKQIYSFPHLKEVCSFYKKPKSSMYKYAINLYDTTNIFFSNLFYKNKKELSQIIKEPVEYPSYFRNAKEGEIFVVVCFVEDVYRSVNGVKIMYIDEKNYFGSVFLRKNVYTKTPIEGVINILKVKKERYEYKLLECSILKEE